MSKHEGYSESGTSDRLHSIAGFCVVGETEELFNLRVRLMRQQCQDRRRARNEKARRRWRLRRKTIRA